MDETGRRVRDALLRLPDGDPAARERAVARATELTARRAARRPRRLALAGALAAAAVGTGVALAGTGAIDVPVGGWDEPPARRADAAPRPLAVPPGAHGIAVVAGGRLHLRIRGGVGVTGLPARTAELSPNARYVAVGLDRGIAALSAAGREAWAHPTPGPVVEVSWSPYPTWIAYVVRDGRRADLHVIEGDGDGDRLVARGVDAAQPHWSPDGAVVHFSRGAAWRSYTPSSGAPPSDGPACGEGCPAWIPPPARTLVRRLGLPITSIVARSSARRAPERDAVALLRETPRGRRLEVWWTPPRTTGAPRLLMRTAGAPGPVHVSVR